MIVFLICVLIGTSVAEHCQSDINISPISNETCHPLPDCTGINCTAKTPNTPTTVYYTVTVENCEDPVLANFSFYINSSRLYSMVYNDSTVLPYYGGYHLDWTMYRNASHLFFHSEVYNGTDLMAAFVPHTVISLNASDCMCQSIQSVAELGESPVETNCTSNPKCTGLECTFHYNSTDYRVETEVDPCTYPPGIDFYIKSVQTNQVLFHRFFNTSSNTTILGSFPLHVTVEHRNYSMIISIDLIAGANVYHLVPRSQIILDESNCGNMETVGGEFDATLIAAVLVPLMVVGSMTVLIVLVVAFVVFKIRKRRSGMRGFHRLSLGNDVDVAADDGDDKNL